MTKTAANIVRAYDSIGRTFAFHANGSARYADDVTFRWIGRCKTCRTAHKIEGRLATALRGSVADTVILAKDGNILVTGCNGTDHSRVTVACGDHRVTLKRVTEGRKHSKHECNAKCLASTGPNCDCKCKGANHGANL